MDGLILGGLVGAVGFLLIGALLVGILANIISYLESRDRGS